MNSPKHGRDLSALATDAVSYTTSSLARHMNECKRAQSRWFGMQAKAELAHTLVSSRLVTCGALVAVGCLALIAIA
ncbi:hypothetical protein [Caenimonas sp. SL110]|uniref:hypothetical protein n=1 Tax=Caenimonas sp. SL110 TaxID=1450524 RepID=UPI0006532465|nr:hypothetical protein [Caenimonas sp. SL110]